jgi:hypothetical protein
MQIKIRDGMGGGETEGRCSLTAIVGVEGRVQARETTNVSATTTSTRRPLEKSYQKRYTKTLPGSGGVSA